MCGIVGIVRPGRPIQAEEILRFTRAVAHRGPDDEGFWLHGGLAFGHRRLAIIDIEHGHQPMSSRDQSIWLTFNGEIYNFKELRTELAARGHRFETRSDTEVIIYAYREWGPDCVKKLRGMFAFAIADLPRRRLFIARDHFGIKPLYYRVTSEFFAFASEIAALREIESTPPEGDLQAVDHYLKFQYIPAPYTIYRDTFKLPPAHYLTVDFDGRVEKTQRFWHLSESPKLHLSDEQWKDRFDAVIEESVGAHLVADVPFGLLLSGGNDSTAVAQAITRRCADRVSAFSVGFPIEQYSELPYARSAASKLGVDLAVVMATDDLFDELPGLVRHCGEPFGDSSIIPTWHLARFARECVPMVLSGDGGDETLAGYSWHQPWADPDHPYSIPGVDWETQLARWEDSISYFNLQERQALWRSEYQEFVDKNHSATRPLVRWADKSDNLWFAQSMDYQTYLNGDILHKTDIASMYHGLEVRTPLVDTRVIELASRLPVDQRLRKVKDEFVSKYVLKTVLRTRFDRSFTHRPKMGLSIPRSEWLAPGTRGHALARDIILGAGLPLCQWFDVDTTMDIFNRTQNSRGQLWLLLVLALWLDANCDVKFA